MTATDIHVPTRRSRFSPALGLSIALVVVLAPLLMLVQQTLDTGHGGDPEARVMLWVENETRIGIAMAAGVLSIPLLIATTLVIVHLTRGRSPRLAIVGGSLMVGALVALAALQGSEQAAYWMVLAGDPAAAVAQLDVADPGIPGIVLIVMLMAGAVAGTLVLVIAMWRSPLIPRAVAIAKLGWLVTDFLLDWSIVAQLFNLAGALILAWAVLIGFHRRSANTQATPKDD